MKGKDQNLCSTPTSALPVSFISRTPALTLCSSDSDDEELPKPVAISKNAPLLPIAVMPVKRRLASLTLPKPNLQRRRCNNAAILPLQEHPANPYASPCAGVHYYYTNAGQPPRLREHVQPTIAPSSEEDSARPPAPLPELPDFAELEGRRKVTLRRRPLHPQRKQLKRHPASAFDSSHNQLVLPPSDGF